MIQEITIENYKSIQSLSIELGRVTVFIGENGCGKSNILEAIALGSAAAADKLDNEFLAPRGIRVTDPQLMRSAFDKDSSKHIKINFKNIDNQNFDFSFKIEGKDYPIYKIENPKRKNINHILEQQLTAVRIQFEKDKHLTQEHLDNAIKNLYDNFSKKIEDKIYEEIENSARELNDNGILNFIVFLLEFSKIQNFKEEGQILPLGIHG